MSDGPRSFASRPIDFLQQICFYKVLMFILSRLVVGMLVVMSLASCTQLQPQKVATPIPISAYHKVNKNDHCRTCGEPLSRAIWRQDPVSRTIVLTCSKPPIDSTIDYSGWGIVNKSDHCRTCGHSLSESGYWQNPVSGWIILACPND
jgi:hypothetical protein